jgi:hypothetical protein
MSQKTVVADSAVEAMEMSSERMPVTVPPLSLSRATHCKMRPGTASVTSSQPLTIVISVSGSNSAPGIISAPLATRYASTPAEVKD